jgi:hypothetical protein
MIDDPSRAADVLPTLRTRNWVILGLLMMAIGACGATAYGLWLLKCMAKAAFAAAIAVGWPV